MATLLTIFPFLGIVAFVLLWTHIMLGVFESQLKKVFKNFDFEAYVRWTALIILICIILHPLFLLVGIGFDLETLFSYGQTYISLGIIGWLLLITYDISKLLQRKYDFFVRQWPKILFISTIGIILIFFHSINLGTHLQSGLLRIIWIFFGVTAIAGAVWIYGIRRLIK